MSITLEHVNYVYSPGTAYEKQALKDVNLTIPQGQFVGIIGHTGEWFSKGNKWKSMFSRGEYLRRGI